MTNYATEPLSTLNTDLNAAVAGVNSLSGYATKEELTVGLAEKADLSAIPQVGDYLPLSGGNVTGRIYLNTTETHIVGSTCVFTLSAAENINFESLGGNIMVNISVSLSVENAGQEFIDMLTNGEWTGEGTDYTVKAHVEATEDLDSASESTTATGTVSFGNSHADGSITIDLNFPRYAEYESNLTINEIIFEDNAGSNPTVHLTYTADYVDYSTQEEYLNDGSSWTVDTVSEEMTVNDPFVLSSELTSAIGSINTILDSINGQII